MPKSRVDIAWIKRRGRDKQFLQEVLGVVKESGSAARLCGHRGQQNCSFCRKLADRLRQSIQVDRLDGLDSTELGALIAKAIGRQRTLKGKIVGCQARLSQPAHYLVARGKSTRWTEDVSEDMILEYEKTLPMDDYHHYSKMTDGKRARALAKKQPFNDNFANAVMKVDRLNRDRSAAIVSLIHQSETTTRSTLDKAGIDPTRQHSPQPTSAYVQCCNLGMPNIYNCWLRDLPNEPDLRGKKYSALCADFTQTWSSVQPELAKFFKLIQPQMCEHFALAINVFGHKRIGKNRVQCVKEMKPQLKALARSIGYDIEKERQIYTYSNMWTVTLVLTRRPVRRCRFY